MSRPLPLPRPNSNEDKDFYYEAQISVLVTGVDEFLWTSICCVDTFFGCETGRKDYLEDDAPVEPATGGSSPLRYPMWNPREFFLVVLSRRIARATREWSTLIEAFEERMNAYVSSTDCDFSLALKLIPKLGRAHRNPRRRPDSHEGINLCSLDYPPLPGYAEDSY